MWSDASQAAIVGTSQVEHVSVTDSLPRHSIPVVDLADTHISEGVPPDGYEIGRVNYQDESNIWKPQGTETMYGGHVPQGNERQRHVLTYPPGEVDAVRLTDRDMESLQPGRWLRDNIIDFYIMYLERHRLSPVYRDHVYFFNSFFFTRLVESTTEGNIDYEQVRNWTKDVNLFEKKYIFIPINQSWHWSLIIICNPASLLYKQKGSPYILHLDSLRDRYPHDIETYIRQYIIEAWKEKYQAGRDDRFRSCLIMRFVRAEVPEQENRYDCGIYLLHYIEFFLQKLEVSSNLEFALMDHTLPTDQIPGIWFESSEVSMKRKEIEDTIISLSQETSTCMGDKAAQLAATKPSQEQAWTSLSRPKGEKRKRNSNWAVEETSILVQCKKEAAVDNGSRFCKGKPDVTNWDAIAEEINSKLAPMPIRKTGDQCRLRWDTLVKSYQRAKEHCRSSSKEFAELTKNEREELKLATTLSDVEWYEVIDQFCPPKSRKSKSQKPDNVVPNVDTLPWPPNNPTHSESPVQTGIGSFEARGPSTKEAEVQDVYGEPVAWNCDVGLPSHSQQTQLQHQHLLGEQNLVEPCVEVGKFQLEGEIEKLKRVNDSLMLELVQMRQQQQQQIMVWKMQGLAQVIPGSSVLNGDLNAVGFGSRVPIQSPDPEPRKSSRQQVSLSESPAGCHDDNDMAIPKFDSMSLDLRSTILNLVQAWPTLIIIWEMKEVCRWLAIVQDRSALETSSYLLKLLSLNLLTISSGDEEECVLKLSRLRAYKKFVKAVINKNPDYDIHKRMLHLDISELSFESTFVPQRIRVLTLFECGNLERVDLGKLPMLRCLSIFGCHKLKAILGWENLGELGWLEIRDCSSFHEHLKVHCLPSLKEFIVCGVSDKADPLTRFTLDFSRCVRLRQMKIGKGVYTTKSVDLSTLKYLEELTFSECDALESVVGLNELHALTAVTFSGCRALKTLPHLGHLKALDKSELSRSSVETIPGFENLHSLTHLTICGGSALKRIPDLGGLRALSYLNIDGTNVDEIQGLDSLHSLTYLSLSGNKALKRLPYLGHLKELAYLDISDTGVDEIPGVRELVNMVRLDCRDSQLEWLPDLGHLPRLKGVYLDGTPLIRVPSSRYFEKETVRFEKGVKWAEEVADVGDSDYVPSDQEVYNEETRFYESSDGRESSDSDFG